MFAGFRAREFYYIAVEILEQLPTTGLVGKSYQYKVDIAETCVLENMRSYQEHGVKELFPNHAAILIKSLLKSPPKSNQIETITEVIARSLKVFINHASMFRACKVIYLQALTTQKLPANIQRRMALFSLPAH